MSNEPMIYAGALLYLAMILWGLSFPFTWVVQRLWEWRAGGWPASDWYYRVGHIKGVMNFLAVLAAINFMYHAFTYFLS